MPKQTRTGRVWPLGGLMVAAGALMALTPATGRAQSAPMSQGADQMQQMRQQLDTQAQEIQALKAQIQSLAGERSATQSTMSQPMGAGAVGAATAASAAAPAGTMAAAAAAPASTGDALTFHGITFYGVVDVGVSYQSHGAPLSDYTPVGVQSLISKSSNRANTSISPNGLSQSRIGLRGSEDIADNWKVLFQVETGFEPTSGQLADGPRSVAQANGVPLGNQITSADSSHAGQAIDRVVYAGVSNTLWGTLTAGRQNTILADQVATYDPQQSSYAFSVVGYSGVTGGAGDTEDYRLDNVLKYTNKIGPIRVGALYQFGEDNGNHGGAQQFTLGTDYDNFSIDATYTHKQDAIGIAPLSSTQMLQASQLGYSPNSSLAATVSDNTSYAVMGSYAYKAAKFYGGYEYIEYANPSVPLRAGFTDIGGYTLAFINNNAFTHHKILEVEWTGFRYAVTPALTWSSGYYHYDQNSFSGNGCADSKAASCSGQLDAVSTTLDYRFNLHFDTYAGVMYSHVSNGLAAGYLHTGTISPAGGIRLMF